MKPLLAILVSSSVILGAGATWSASAGARGDVVPSIEQRGELALSSDHAIDQDWAFVNSAPLGGTQYVEPLALAKGQKVATHRCGVRDLSMEEVRRVELEADRIFEREGYAHRVGDEVVIPVAWHVINKGESRADGNMPDEMIEASIDVLNDAYADMNITFVLDSVDRTTDRGWYTMAPGTPAERQAKTALTVDAKTHFNVYSASPGLGLLGWATFPWSLRFNTAMDGVVILNESMPGGTVNNYDEGDTLTHEAGHWLGLYHTFQGGCTDGDGVADTPAEGTSTSGCPLNKDTCVGGGPDPINNFMDYSYDSGMFEFTPGQADRALQCSGLFRRDLF